MNRVDAFIQTFGNNVTRVIHHVGVVTGTAYHSIQAGAAIEQVAALVAGQAVVTRQAKEPVVAGVADKNVVQLVAGGVNVRRAGQGHVFHIGGEGVAHRREHGIGVRIGGLDYHVADVIDDIAVVAGTTRHTVRAGAAVNKVRAAVTNNGVVLGATGTVNVGTAG